MKQRYTALIKDTGVTFNHRWHRVTVIASSPRDAIRKMLYKQNAEWFKPKEMAHRISIKKKMRELADGGIYYDRHGRRLSTGGWKILRRPQYHAAVFQDPKNPTFYSPYGTDFWWGATIRQLRATSLG